MMQRRLGDQQVRDRCTVPHSVMMREIALEAKRSVKDVSRCGDDAKTRVNVGFQNVVLRGCPRGIRRHKLADRADEQQVAQL